MQMGSVSPKVAVKREGAKAAAHRFELADIELDVFLFFAQLKGGSAPPQRRGIGVGQQSKGQQLDGQQLVAGKAVQTADTIFFFIVTLKGRKFFSPLACAQGKLWAARRLLPKNTAPWLFVGQKIWKRELVLYFFTTKYL
jgi:hypothetical protein